MFCFSWSHEVTEMGNSPSIFYLFFTVCPQVKIKLLYFGGMASGRYLITSFPRLWKQRFDLIVEYILVLIRLKRELPRH